MRYDRVYYCLRFFGTPFEGRFPKNSQGRYFAEFYNQLLELIMSSIEKIRVDLVKPLAFLDDINCTLFGGNESLHGLSLITMGLTKNNPISGLG